MSRTTHRGEELKKDREFWFHDGNIVVLAGGTAFRLHKSILSSISPIFEDMFSIIQSEGAEMMNGCQVVRLSDSPSDLRHFFRLSIKPSFSYLGKDFIPSFRTLAAVCRIGHKYQATEAVEVASERIEAFLNGSSILSDPYLSRRSWDVFWEEYQRRMGFRMELTDAIEAVNLLRLLGRPEVPPFALYLCYAGDPLHLRNGVPREDGTIERLSDEDYRVCAQAIPRLLAKRARDVGPSLTYYNDSPGRETYAHRGAVDKVFRARRLYG